MLISGKADGSISLGSIVSGAIDSPSHAALGSLFLAMTTFSSGRLAAYIYVRVLRIYAIRDLICDVELNRSAVAL